jgi:hypothetical protein
MDKDKGFPKKSPALNIHHSNPIILQAYWPKQHTYWLNLAKGGDRP